MPHLANLLPFAPQLAGLFGIDPLLPMQNTVTVSAKSDALRRNFFHCLGIRPVFNQGTDNELVFTDHVMEINSRRMIEPANKTFLRRFELNPQGPGIAFIDSRTGLVFNFIFLIPAFIRLCILSRANFGIFIRHIVFK